MIPYTPAVNWRIRVWSGNAWRQGAPKETLTPDQGPVSIDALNLTPQGDSLDGSFTVVPAGLNIAARDTLTVETHDGANWIPRYAGIIATAGNPRSTDRQAYRTAGIRQRLFETIVQTGYLDTGDVAAQVRSILNEARHRPTGTTYTSGDVPDLGFQIGPRATAWETVGDFLDAMAGFVGSFAVPSGQTYTYDGHTYTAGQTVPPVYWGVRPDGSIYFRRPPPAAPAAFHEGDQRTTVDWQQINAEDATGDVLLLYLGAVNTTAPKLSIKSLEIPGVFSTDNPDFMPVLPVARLNGREPYDSAAPATSHATRLQVDGPLDLMDLVPLAEYTGGGYNFGPGTPATPLDGNPSTYVEMEPTIYPEPPLTPPPAGNLLWYLDVRQHAAREYKDGMWRIEYLVEAPDGRGPTLTTRLQTTSPARVNDATYHLESTEGQRQTLWIPNVLAAPWPNNPLFPTYTVAQLSLSWYHMWFDGAAVNSYIRVYTIGYYVPDADLLDGAAKDTSRSARFADAHRRAPAPEVARITYHGDGPHTHEITVNPQTGGTVTAWIERITLAMTTAAGITTTYYAGQEWPAQVQEQRILLERLARRSVQGGGRRR